jgi:beta-D-xylosidase 4
MLCFIFIIIFIRTVFLNAQTNIFPDCKSGPLASFPICDQSLPIYERAVDLISRMTIQEKANWLSNTVQPIPRLGLPSYQWWNEALHGVMYLKAHADGVPEATSFPAPINLGATFNLNLIHRIANIISTEARAANNENITGLSFFTPDINIVRDPRWGRGQEIPGEDPFLVSQYVSALVRGLQEGEDNRYLKIAATCKHFIAYDMDAWNGSSRWSFNAKVSDQDLVETFLPPFETCIRDAHVTSIMGSLNAINGIPACAHQFLFQTIARLKKQNLFFKLIFYLNRDTFHFDGYAVCDCGAIQNIMTGHHYTSNNPDTVAAALHAGLDLDCGNYYSANIPIALNNKTIVQADIDQASLRTFSVLIRLGYFDPPEQQIYRNLSRININTPEAQQLALLSAQQSIVLLKNMNNYLPLNIDQLTNKTIALIGPSINATVLMQSSYHGPAPFLISPLMAFNTITSSILLFKRVFFVDNIYF